MASELVVPVVSLKNLHEHPNASLLGLADVLGYQMVIPLVEDASGTIVRTFVKGKYDQAGKRVAYDPVADALVAGMASGGGLVKVETEDVNFKYKYAEGQLVV